MKKVKPVSDSNGNRLGWMIFCPGCREYHLLNHLWYFNGDEENPTFTPSLMVQSGHYLDGHKGDHCWCTYNKEHPESPTSFTCYRCHSYVIDGRIQFLPDSTHDLSGQTVDLDVID